MLLLSCQRVTLLDPTDSADTWTDPSGWLELGEIQSCSSPLDEPEWEEVGGELGFIEGPSIDASHERNGGLSVVDIDVDGDLDFVVGYDLIGHETGNWIRTDTYIREGDSYQYEEMAMEMMGASSLNLGDLDGDGDLDLIASQGYMRLPEQEMVMFPELEHLDGAYSREASPADVDGDGDLDLTIGVARLENHGDYRDVILINEDGEFSLGTILPENGAHFDSVWLDIEHDGDPDLYVVNDQGYDWGGNRLYLNDGGSFSTSDACDCDLEMDGMSGDLGDFNGDGEWDLYLASSMYNALLQGTGSGSFIDVTAAVDANPIVKPVMGWSGRWADMDNDGLLDLLTLQGDQYYTPSGNPEAPGAISLLRQTEEGFEQRDFEIASWRSVVVFDENEDGVQDFLVSEVVERPRLYRSTGCTQKSWLQVEAPIGSTVRIEVEGVSQMRSVHTDSSYGASGPPVVHFGLGDAATVDTLTVRLPWGEEWTTGDISGRQRVRVSAP